MHDKLVERTLKNAHLTDIEVRDAAIATLRKKLAAAEGKIERLHTKLGELRALPDGTILRVTIDVLPEHTTFSSKCDVTLDFGVATDAFMRAAKAIGREIKDRAKCPFSPESKAAQAEAEAEAERLHSTSKA